MFIGSNVACLLAGENKSEEKESQYQWKISNSVTRYTCFVWREKERLAHWTHQMSVDDMSTHTPQHNVNKYDKYKITYKTFVRPGFFFANITALFSRDNSIMDGFTLHASPSTCIGIVFVVTIFAVRHCVIHVPCPPACRSGNWYVVKPTTSISPSSVHGSYWPPDLFQGCVPPP